jgi:polyhydroxybutyrate depolymerase
MKRHILFLIIPFLFLQSCTNQSSDTNTEDTTTTSCYSNLNAQTISHDGENRDYILYVPSSYDGLSPVPLMMNFHGYGGTASEFINDADMRAVADANEFILVYPQGSCLEGSPHWNPCLSDEDNKSSVDDLGFVEALVNEISSQYNLDIERIYAAGFSNGGMMAYGLANYKSDLVAAVSSVSGVMLTCAGAISHPIPVLHLHGTSDSVIPYEGNSLFLSAQNVLDSWIDFNNTTTTATINSETIDGRTVEHYIYDEGDNNVSVEHYKYIGGNHTWFRTTYQGNTTAQLIWNFVSRYDINGLR